MPQKKEDRDKATGQRDKAAGRVQARIDAICASNLLDSSGTVIFFKDLQSRFISVSRDCAQLSNLTRDEMVGLTDFDLTDHAHAMALFEDEQRIIATGEPMIDKEEVDRLANQPGTWVETSKFPLRDAGGAIVGTFGISRDVTRWEVAERALTRMAVASRDANAKLTRVEEQLRAVLNGSTDVIAKYDADLRYQYINPAGERSRGLTLDQLTGRTDRESGMSASSLLVYEPALGRVLDTGVAEVVELCVRDDPHGEEAWFHILLSPDCDTTGAVVGVLTSMRDASEIKRAELALAHQAAHDPLTGVANRYLLMDRLGQALVRMERNPQRLALLFIDLDHFKDINDSYGHEIGDRVLVDVARRLERVARREDTIARLGGDEFILLCDQMMTEVDVREIASRVVHALAEPFDNGAVTFGLSASVGAVVTDDPQTDASWLLKSADSAMYRAKEGGRNRFEVFV